MQKIHSARKHIALNPDGDWFGGFYLDYYMIKSEIKIPNSAIKATVYGVEIEKKQEENGTETVLESASIRDIFASPENTGRLISRLSEKMVMPSTLEYVIDELLGESGLEPPEIKYSGVFGA